jgi:hypothetical protein
MASEFPSAQGWRTISGAIYLQRLLRLDDPGMSPFRRVELPGTAPVPEPVPGLLRWFLFLLLRLVSLLWIAVGPRPELNLPVAARGSTQMICSSHLRPVEETSTLQNVLGVGRRTII